MSYLAALSTEFLKLRRTRIPWVLGLIYGIAPLMLGLMMLVLKDPELGRRMGLITAKAEMTIGAADWPTYLTIVGFLFFGGIIVQAVAQAFVFGDKDNGGPRSLRAKVNEGFGALRLVQRRLGGEGVADRGV